MSTTSQSYPSPSPASDLRHRRIMTYTLRALMVVVFVFIIRVWDEGSGIRLFWLFFSEMTLVVGHYYLSTGRESVAMLMMQFVLMTAAIVAVTTMGAGEHVAYGWFLVLVVLAALLGNRRQALFWALLASLCIGVLLVLDEVFSVFGAYQSIGLTSSLLHIYGQLAVLTTVLIGCIANNERAQDAMQRQMADYRIEIKRRQAAQHRAEVADANKTQFLANISHEVRTPLNSIIGFSNRLLKNAALYPHQDREALETINRNGQMLLCLLDELLEMSRLDSQPLQITPVAFSAAELLRECADRLEPTAVSYGLSLTFEAMDDVRIRGDSVRLHQMMIQVLTFAISQTLEGSINVSLSKMSRGAQGGLRIAVTDTSPGFNDEQLKGLFDQHYQLVFNARRAVPITGFSLALAAKVARLHGGDIEVRSRLGQGSVYLIWLPVRSESEVASVMEEAAELDPV